MNETIEDAVRTATMEDEPHRECVYVRRDPSGWHVHVGREGTDWGIRMREYDEAALSKVADDVRCVWDDEWDDDHVGRWT